MASTESRGLSTSWASWLPFQCLPLPFIGSRRSHMRSTHSFSTGQGDWGRLSDEPARVRTSARKHVIYNEPSQHPRPTTAPEMASYLSDLTGSTVGGRTRSKGNRTMSASLTPVTSTSTISQAENPQRNRIDISELLMPDSKLESPPRPPPTIKSRHFSTGSPFATPLSAEIYDIPSVASRCQCSLGTSALNSQRPKTATATMESQNQDIRKSYSFIPIPFIRKPMTKTTDDAPSTTTNHDISLGTMANTFEPKSLAKELSPAEKAYQQKFTGGVRTSTRISTIRKPEMAINTTAAETPSFETVKISVVSPMPPPPLPLMLLPQQEGRRSLSRVPSWLVSVRNRCASPVDSITNTPRQITAREGFYRPFSPNLFQPLQSSESINSFTTWNTDDIRAIQSNLVPSDKPVMRKVKKNVPQIVSVEGITGLTPPVRAQRAA